MYNKIFIFYKQLLINKGKYNEIIYDIYNDLIYFKCRFC